MNPVKKSKHENYQTVSHPAMKWHCACFKVTAEAASDDQISKTIDNWSDYDSQFSRVIAPVTVQEDNDVRVSHGFCTGQASRPISRAMLANDPCPGSGRLLRGMVGGAVVDNYDLLHHTSGHSPYHISYSQLFI